MAFREVFFLFLTFYVIKANPQQSIDDRIQNVFGTVNPDKRAGFGDIVTAEPEVIPTATPQFLSNNGQSCKCVPYTMCTPSSVPLTTDSRFFGELDIRCAG